MVAAAEPPDHPAHGTSATGTFAHVPAKLLVSTVLDAIAAAVPASASAADRYAFANGCYTATDTAGARVAERVRMKPTALGRYMLYRTDATFTAAQPDGSWPRHRAPARRPTSPSRTPAPTPSSSSRSRRRRPSRPSGSPPPKGAPSSPKRT